MRVVAWRCFKEPSQNWMDTGKREVRKRTRAVGERMRGNGH